MEIMRRCLSCQHHAEDTTPKQQPLIGHKTYLCLANPPTSSATLTPQGVVVIASYPQVNKDSISCACFAALRVE